MSSPSCTDVCEVVTDWLIQMGFRLDLEAEDHTDVLEALDQVHLVLNEDAIPQKQSAFDKSLEVSQTECIKEGYTSGEIVEDEEMEGKCYYNDPVCTGELWQCETCEEWFYQTHWHETTKGRNVECVACERVRCVKSLAE